MISKQADKATKVRLYYEEHPQTSLPAMLQDSSHSKYQQVSSALGTRPYSAEIWASGLVKPMEMQTLDHLG